MEAILFRNDARVFETLYACALLWAVPLNWPVARRAGVPQTLLWASDQGDADGYEPLATSEAVAGWVPAPVPEDAPWTIIHTSGTTGTPRGVQITHRGALASVLGILVAHGVSADSRCLTVLPTFHVAGLRRRALPETLIACCRERLATYKVPTMIKIVDELPRNATGKLAKAPLRAEAAAW